MQDFNKIIKVYGSWSLAKFSIFLVKYLISRRKLGFNRPSSNISEKSGILFEKFSTLASSNYHRVFLPQSFYFLLKFCACFLINFLFCLDLELLIKSKKPGFSECVESRTFKFLQETQDLKINKWIIIIKKKQEVQLQWTPGT